MGVVIRIKAPAMGAALEHAKHQAEAFVRDARNEIIDQMEPGPPRAGREYPQTATMSNIDRSKNSGPRPMYRASAPGQPPAVDTGFYVGSWQVTAPVVHATRVVASAFNDRKTADGQHSVGAVLEYGTTDGKIAPRPHIRPAVDVVKRKYGIT